MFGQINKSQESFLELFQNAAQAQARSSQSSHDSPKKESLKNILVSKSPLLSPASNSENGSTALKNFPLRGVSENSGSSEAFQQSNESEILVQFKKATLEGKNFPGGMLAISGPYLAYLVNERKVRIFNTETGQRCSIDRAQGIIVGLAWSDGVGLAGETFLAVLAEDGEITIGKISAEEAEEDDNELSFEVTSILSFPEVGRARAISWNLGEGIGGKKHLAVYGSASSDVFFVHCSPIINGKISFVNTSVQDIKNVSLMENGSCWVIGRNGCVECFQYSGTSYQPKFSLKLPIQFLDAVKVVEMSGSTFFIALSDKVLNILALANSGGGEATEISSIELDVPANELILDRFTQTVILFSHGKRVVQVVSLAKMKSPRLIPQDLNPKSFVVLDAIFNSKNCSINGESVDFSALFYFSDSICCQGGSYELEFDVESNSSEFDDPTQMEPEESASANELAETAEEFSSSSVPNNQTSLLDMNSLRTEIKLIVREAIKDSLTEVIHEALNQGIRAGFNQISEDLMELTKTLIKSVDDDMDISSLDAPKSQTLSIGISDETQTILNLIAQNKFGAALRKSAAIGSSRLLLQVCQKFEDPFAALDEEQFSQETLIQMFGLLSLDIDEDTEIKLDWLQEILIQIDYDSILIASSRLAEQVDNLFVELKSLVNDSLVDGNLQKKMKTVMRLLRKFQIS